MPEIIDPVFAKTSPKRSFCMTETERFGLVFGKTGSINSVNVGDLNLKKYISIIIFFQTTSLYNFHLPDSEECFL